MSEIVDNIGRTFSFDQIRFKMDESLLQQATSEVVSQNSRERPQLVFDRYCLLHHAKYLRNYEPAHFSNGRLKEEYRSIYDNKLPLIRISIDVANGALFNRYVGMPVEEIEAAVKRDPRAWFMAGKLIVVQQ